MAEEKLSIAAVLKLDDSQFVDEVERRPDLIRAMDQAGQKERRGLKHDIDPGVAALRVRITSLSDSMSPEPTVEEQRVFDAATRIYEYLHSAEPRPDIVDGGTARPGPPDRTLEQIEQEIATNNRSLGTFQDLHRHARDAGVGDFIERDERRDILANPGKLIDRVKAAKAAKIGEPNSKA